MVDEHTWWVHIIDGDEGHPEMVGKEYEVLRCVKDPDFVTRSANPNAHDVRIFYRAGAWGPDVPDLLKVVTLFGYDQDGIVVGDIRTAFAIQSMSLGEQVLWRRSKQTKP
jgi:hypothetical protein